MCTWVQVPVDRRKGHKFLETGVRVYSFVSCLM